MWRYAREIKQVDDTPLIGHSHRPSAQGTFQNVGIATNSLGMRGPEPSKRASVKTALLLGSSITLGWGVNEEDTLRAVADHELRGKWQVLNGGIGNFNALRAVSLFRTKWRGKIHPDAVVVHYFVGDADKLAPSKENFVMHNSMLAVSLYYMVHQLFEGERGVDNLIRRYRAAYDPSAPGYVEMLGALADLNIMAKEDGFRVVLAMMPDVHQLQNYPFGFIHERMKEIAAEKGWTYIDFLDELKNFKGPELWAIPGDPHPNADAHRLMGLRLAQVLAQEE